MASGNGFVGEPSGLPRRLGQPMRKREGEALPYENQEPQATRACATRLSLAAVRDEALQPWRGPYEEIVGIGLRVYGFNLWW